MVRNDDFFLRKWIAYYGDRLGRENLFVYFDGKDQTVPDFCAGVNVTLCERHAGDVAGSDRTRARFLSQQAAMRMSEGYDLAIGTDVDEFLVVDPALGQDLHEFLSSRRIGVSLSALGIDVGQNLNSEKRIDPARPFLRQRRYAYVYSRYTKASVLAKPCRWGSGFHRVKGHNLHIAEGLYLFHFGCVDLDRLRDRMDDKDRLEAGWSKHLAKRARTIKIVSGIKARKWEPTVRFMRRMHQYCRPIFAVNKPTAFGLRRVVEIPERFADIV